MTILAQFVPNLDATASISAAGGTFLAGARANSNDLRGPDDKAGIHQGLKPSPSGRWIFPLSRYLMHLLVCWMAQAAKGPSIPQNPALVTFGRLLAWRPFTPHRMQIATHCVILAEQGGEVSRPLLEAVQ